MLSDFLGVFFFDYFAQKLHTGLFSCSKHCPVLFFFLLFCALVFFVQNRKQKKLIKFFVS